MRAYYETIHIVERLHRLSLDMLKRELDRLGIEDINNIQTLILYNIGKDSLTVGEFTGRGYYLGSNVSYNLKKMVDSGYVLQERSARDKRSVRVKISEKGARLRDHLDLLFERHEEMLRGIGLGKDGLVQVQETLSKLERFWSAQSDPSLSAI